MSQIDANISYENRLEVEKFSSIQTQLVFVFEGRENDLHMPPLANENQSVQTHEYMLSITYEHNIAAIWAGERNYWLFRIFYLCIRHRSISHQHYQFDDRMAKGDCAQTYI